MTSIAIAPCPPRSRTLARGILAATLALATLAASPSAPATNAPFPLVDGDRQAIIVSGEQSAKERLGWRYEGDCDVVARMGAGGGTNLQAWIEKSTGQKLKLISEKEYAPQKAPFPIFVGSTAKARELFGEKLKTLDPDGYIVHVAPTFVLLAGNVEYAEFDFLRTYLGVESYVPIKLFTVVPKYNRVMIPPGTRIELPVFFSRAFSNLRTDTGLDTPELPWRLHPSAGNGRYKFHHAIHCFITAEEFGKDHPEYFPLIGGQRLIASGSDKPGPCLSNSNVVNIIIKKCRDYFDKNPEALAISLGMPDVGAGKWCECPACKAMDNASVKIGGKTSLRSNRYYAFLNQVAKALQQSHPGKSVGTLGYLGTENPPSFPLERNIIVYICDNRADWCNPSEKTKDLEMIDAWMERGDHVGIYEYMYGMGFSVPRLYSRALAEFLRHVGNKRPGSGFYAEVYSNHGLDGPKPWLVEKLLWNPNQDVDALMDQWATACFGPAAKPMKKYFDLLEETWMRNGEKVKPSGILWGYRQEIQYEMFRPEDLPPLWKLLEEAQAKAGADETILKRIRYFADTFKISDEMARRYHAFAETAQLTKDKAAPEQVMASLLRHAPEVSAFDLESHIIRVWAEEPCAYTGNGQPKRAMQAMHYICDTGPWQTVHAQLDAGERNPSNLVRQAAAGLFKLAPVGYENNAAAKAAMHKLQRMADRVAGAKRAAQPPTIDGNPDEPCWTWVDQNPWTLLNSGTPVTYRTQFAWAYDDENLYLALRCFDQAARYAVGLDPARALPGGGAPWIFPSIEVELVPDARDMQRPLYQLTISMKGGVWESGTKVLASSKTTETGPETWQAELAFKWKMLGVDPGKISALRVNLRRNIRKRFVPSVSAWYATFFPYKAAPAPASRGWLVLEP